MRISRFEVMMRDTGVTEAHSGVCKDAQLTPSGVIAGKRWIEEEAALTILIPMDLCSTEDHGHHLPE